MYTLDQQAARKADTSGAQIKEIGKYIGSFTQAEDIKTKKGGRGVALSFQSASGQKAKLPIYTTMANGEKISGFEVLSAIMTCMGLKGIKPVQGTVKHYDYETKKDIEEVGSIFPELCKPIGVLLETEDFEKQDGSVGTRMILKNVFQANTELTATEIWDRETQPKQLEKMVASLRHRPLKGNKQAPRQATGDMPDFAPMGDDEYPF